MSEETPIERLIKIAKKVVEGGEKIDPFDVALSVSEELLRPYLSLSMLERLPEAVVEAEKMQNKVASIIARELACSGDYLERAVRFYTLLITGRTVFSPTARCIYVKSLSKGMLRVACIDLRRALYKYLAGEVEPITL